MSNKLKSPKKLVLAPSWLLVCLSAHSMDRVGRDDIVADKTCDCIYHRTERIPANIRRDGGVARMVRSFFPLSFFEFHILQRNCSHISPGVASFDASMRFGGQDLLVSAGRRANERNQTEKIFEL